MVHEILDTLKATVGDHELRDQLRQWFEKPKRSWWARFWSSEMSKILVTFLLTGVVGTLLTNHYADKQRQLEDKRQEGRLIADRAYQAGEKQLERTRSFADKLNETRVAKIAEVWEVVCLHEAAAARAIDSWNESTLMSAKAMAKAIGPRTIQETLEDPDVKAAAKQAADDFNAVNTLAVSVAYLSDKNRFWLGEAAYEKIHAYLTETNQIFKTSGLGSGTQIETRRKQARATLIEVRDAVLKE